MRVQTLEILADDEHAEASEHRDPRNPSESARVPGVFPGILKPFPDNGEMIIYN